MKIDRLIGILVALLQKEKVTAPWLAEKFEVSRRTINRDIETLCRAGIPIVTWQGRDGGISIMEGYAVDKTLFTSEEMRAILAGLKSLDSVSNTSRYTQLMEKLAPGNEEVLISNEHIMIDLSSWYGATLVPKIELIQEAISKRRRISFQYFSPKSGTKRKVEPYQLIFKWSSWYVWGMCTDKKEFRLFKLNRMIDLACANEIYVPMPMPKPQLTAGKVLAQKFRLKAVFAPTARWRLVEEFGVDSFYEGEDGKLYFAFEFTDEEEAIRWIATFGDQAEILSPVSLRQKFGEMIADVYKKYRT